MGKYARFVNLFVLIFVCIFTVYLLKLFCSATVPLCDTIVLSRARHIWLTSFDASKWYWDGYSLYRKMTFPKCSAPVCSCIIFTSPLLSLPSFSVGILLTADYMHCKDTTSKIRNKNISRKRNCVASVPIPTFMCLWAIYMYIYSHDRSAYSAAGK